MIPPSEKNPSPVVISHQNPPKYFHLWTDIFIFLWFRWDTFLLEKATSWMEVLYFSLKLEKAISWIKQVLYFSLKKQFEVKNFLIMDLFLINTELFASQDVNRWAGVMWITCGLLWCFYQLFGLSFWRHPFTTEDPFVSKWCNDTFIRMFFDIETNSTTSWMA